MLRECRDGERANQCELAAPIRRSGRALNA